MTSTAILATASYDHTIKFWNAATGVCTQTVQHKESQVNALEITPDACQLAAAGFQHIRMYDLTAGTPTPIIDYEGVSKNVTAVGFQAEGRWMFTGGEDCTAKVWDMRVRQLQCQRIFQVNTPVNSVCLHPNQVELFVGDSNGSLYMWDLRTDHNDTLHLDSSPTSIQHVCVDAEGTMLSAMTNRGNLYVWNLVGTGSTTQDAEGFYRSSRVVPKKKLMAHERYGLKCRFSPDSTLLATTSADETARLWRTADFSEQTVLAARSGEPRHQWVWDCAFTNDSRNLFTCSSDSMMRLWSLETNHVVRQYVGHQRAITAMAFRDGAGVASVS